VNPCDAGSSSGGEYSAEPVGRDALEQPRLWPPVLPGGQPLDNHGLPYRFAGFPVAVGPGDELREVRRRPGEPDLSGHGNHFTVKVEG